VTTPDLSNISLPCRQRLCHSLSSAAVCVLSQSFSEGCNNEAEARARCECKEPLLYNGAECVSPEDCPCLDERDNSTHKVSIAKI
jgi:hypothetical protein